MPTTKIITLYSFDELTEAIQDKVLNNLQEVNVDYDWWQNVYSDAEQIGIDIQSFHILYYKNIEGKLIFSLSESIKAVIAEHGESTETYSIAKHYSDVYQRFFKIWLQDQDKEGYDDWSEADWFSEYELSDEADAIASDYLEEMLQEYLNLLRKEYDYLTSKESVIDTIRANEYLFDENGSVSY